MLSNKSLERTAFTEDELIVLPRPQFKDININLPNNLEQHLVWVDGLGQYNYSQYLKLNQDLLKLTMDDPAYTAIEKSVNHYLHQSYKANRAKDFYLKKLIDKRQAEILGYIKHPNTENNYYAVVLFGTSKYLIAANNDILSKYEIELIDFSNKIPQSIAEIHTDEKELRACVGKLIRAYLDIIKDYKEKKQTIHEHNRIINEIYRRRKKGLVKIIDAKSKQKEVEKMTVTPPTVTQTIIQNEKPIPVIKKRKFTLNKD